MERVTFKSLRELVEKVNEKRNTDITVTPNIYGYGIIDGDRYPNLFNGKANECAAFLKGMLCEPIINN
jgi:hypothetical protein